MVICPGIFLFTVGLHSEGVTSAFWRFVLALRLGRPAAWAFGIADVRIANCLIDL